MAMMVLALLSLISRPRLRARSSLSLSLSQFWFVLLLFLSPLFRCSLSQFPLFLSLIYRAGTSKLERSNAAP